MKVDEWLSVLKLAKMWYFVDIHALAVDQITNRPMDPLERIILAKEYYVTKWLQDAYVELAQRTLAPSVEEIGRIGYSSGTLVFHAREKRITGSRGSVESLVQTVFAEELKDLERQHKSFIGGGLR